MLADVNLTASRLNSQQQSWLKVSLQNVIWLREKKNGGSNLETYREQWPPSWNEYMSS